MASLATTRNAAHAISRLGDEAQRKRWLPAIAEGSLIGTLALTEESDSIDPRDTALVGEPDGDGFRGVVPKRMMDGNSMRIVA